MTNTKNIGYITGILFNEYLSGHIGYDKDSDNCISEMREALENAIVSAKQETDSKDAFSRVTDFYTEVAKSAFYAGMAAMKELQEEIEAMEA